MKKKMNRLANIILILILTHFGRIVYSQDNQSDTLLFSALNKSKIQFILDDTFLFGGMTSSGVYYSNNFRELSYRNGLVFGVEQYLPLKGKVFLCIGLNVSQRNFSYLKNTPNINVNNLYLDVPITSAFELPILKNLDFRLLFGANIGVKMKSNLNGDYDLILNSNPNTFIYDVNDFNKFDFGWTFGLSAEYKDFIFRLRSYSGFIKFDKKDQGMLNSFNFEVGYFLFRTLNKKK
jgi:hypothetical protein